MSDKVEDSIASNEAVQELIDSAELLKRLHDEILAQVRKFDEMTEKLSSLKTPAS